jgi:hypothetical protein
MGFRGLLEYLSAPEKRPEILDSNMAGGDPRTLAREFGTIRRARSDVAKAVFHTSLSLVPGEHLDGDQWREIGRRYLDGMGFEDCQYVMFRHHDTEHEHIHITANRIRYDGKVVSDSLDYRRQEELLRQFEREYGLTQVIPSQEVDLKAPSRGELERTLKTGNPGPRARLQALCTAAAKDCEGLGEYIERLDAVGVYCKPVLQKDDTYVAGLSFSLDGSVWLKGSDLGSGFTAKGLTKRGITYEKERDLPAIRSVLDRQVPDRTIRTDQGLTAGKGREYREPGEPARASSPVHGTAYGRDPDHTRPDQRGIRGPDEDLEGTPGGLGEGVAGSGQGGSDSTDNTRKDDTTVIGKSLPSSSADRSHISGPYDRLVGLAGLDLNDRTSKAIARQLAGFGVKRVDLGVRRLDGTMIQQTIETDELASMVPWLKRENATGSDIYVRPASDTPHALVLVDDLKQDNIERLKRDGFTPVATIETSPGNFQAWIRLSGNPLDPEIRKKASRFLAETYGGDPGSVGSHHYGRLAGFTNRKKQYEKDGLHPYVLVHDISPQIAPQGPKLTQQIEHEINSERVQARIDEIIAGPRSGSHQPDPVAEYRRQARILMDRYGQDMDYSRLDWMIAKDMSRSGRYSKEAIKRAILEASPDIHARKAGHIEDYLTRTVERAWEQGRAERGHDRGL